VSEARVNLVPLGRAHLARTKAWANDPELMRLMDRSQPVTDAEHEAWFEALGRREDCAYFAVETAAPNPKGPGLRIPQHVGNVWLWEIDARHRKAELRIVIGEHEARGQRLGVEAIDQLCRHAFDHLGLHRIYAYVLTINPMARRAFERAGFVVEGTLREDRWTGERFVDAFLLARLKG
jgi:RimJ/RimL family protein N-acetyltransferase